MARPNKQGVDYFPLDIHLDDKFKFIEIKYKLEGFAILIKLLQKIYSYGYWYKWTEDEALLFSDELRTDINLVNKVVNECLDRNVFDKKLHDEFNILTSTGIQKRYKEIVRRRKDVIVTTEYLLIDDSLGINDDINPTSSIQSDDISTQSKVKESKVNKSKENIYREFDYLLLTEKEFERLISEGYEKEDIDNMLDKIENFSGNKKYNNLNLTVRNWLKRDIKVAPKETKVMSNEKILKGLRNRKKDLEMELDCGIESFKHYGGDGLFYDYQKELGEINERLRVIEEAD